MLWRTLTIFMLALFCTATFLGLLRREPIILEWIAFVSTRTTGTHQVYLMSSDGKQLQQLTHDPFQEFSNPTWLSIHELIVWNQFNSYHLDLRTRRLTPTDYHGWNRARMTPNNFPNHVWDYYYSSKSDMMLRIGYDLTTREARMETMPSASSEFSPLLSDWYLMPAEKPLNGEWVLFWSPQRGSDDIYRMRLDGSDLQQLTDSQGGEREPAWSIDGQWITYKLDNYLYVMRGDGSQKRRVAALDYVDFAGWYDLSTLIFSRKSSNNDSYKYAVRITENYPKFFIASSIARWSIAFSGDWWAWFGVQDGKGGLFTQNLITKQSYFVSDNVPWFSWSPDQEWIVFQSNKVGTSEIYRIHPDGTGLQNLTNHPDWDITPAWSPPMEDLPWHPEYFAVLGVVYLGLGGLAVRRRIKHHNEM